MNTDEKLSARASAVQSGSVVNGESISEREAGRREVLAELARAACALPGTAYDRTPGVMWLIRLGDHFGIDTDPMLGAQPKSRPYGD